MTLEQALKRIEELEAQIKVLKFLNWGRQDVYDNWEHALYQYARREVDGPGAASKALGIGEYWDAEHPDKWFLRMRRVWRRLTDWFE